MALVSAGLLMFKENNGKLEVFLVHPGGPLLKNKDKGYWGIPKGLQEDNEDLLQTAIREFNEETGIVPFGEYLHLGSVKQKNNKIVHAWAFRNEDNLHLPIQSNTFEMEWPPHSGNKQHFPEIDEGRFFTPEDAMEMIVEAQRDFILLLQKLLNK